MLPDMIKQIVQLGSEIAIVCLFLWYLTRRDAQTKDLAQEGHEVVRELSNSFDDLKTAINVQTEVMRKSKSE